MALITNDNTYVFEIYVETGSFGSFERIHRVLEVPPKLPWGDQKPSPAALDAVSMTASSVIR